MRTLGNPEGNAIFGPERFGAMHGTRGIYLAL